MTKDAAREPMEIVRDVLQAITTGLALLYYVSAFPLGQILFVYQQY